MWSIVLLIGFISFIVGLVKHKENWGKTIATIGGIAVVVSVIVAGPEMADAAITGFQQGFQKG